MRAAKFNNSNLASSPAGQGVGQPLGVGLHLGHLGHEPTLTTAVFPGSATGANDVGVRRQDLIVSFHGPVSFRGSRGSPSTRSPMMFRCTSELPE